MRLHLSLDPVTAIRALGGGTQPEPGAVALLAELGGVGGLSFHLRDDQRMAGERDVRVLREMASVHFDLQLAPAADLVSTAFDVRPDRVTLVPEARGGAVVAGGLDVTLLKDALRKHVSHLRDADVEVAMRVEPNLDQVRALHRLDADVVVFNAGGYTSARDASGRRVELGRLTDAAQLASRLGLGVAVSGGLDLRAVERLAAIPGLTEVHVGHACIARGLLRGIERAVGDFLGVIHQGAARL